MIARIHAAVVGATGYAGMELVRLLALHPYARFSVVDGSGERAGTRFSELAPALSGIVDPSLSMQPLSWTALRNNGVDVVFLATPHEQSRAWVPQALAAGLRVIDLSGAWRLTCAQHRAVYGFHDENAAAAEQLHKVAVYGLPELHREQLAGAHLIANPGCYATCVILALAPLLRAGLADIAAGVIADAKSGISGAGKTPTATTHFMNAAENLSAYGLYAHRHTGELIEQLGIPADSLTFTPHLLPIQRGILATNYVTLRTPLTADELHNLYTEFYAGSPMVRVRGTQLPAISFAAHTNFCDIGFALAPEGKRVTIISCLDNLLKGAAGQAVQNMNLAFGFSESEGLL